MFDDSLLLRDRKRRPPDVLHVGDSEHMRPRGPTCDDETPSAVGLNSSTCTHRPTGQKRLPLFTWTPPETGRLHGVTSTDTLTAAARIVNGTKTCSDETPPCHTPRVNVEFGSRAPAIMGPSGSGKSTLMHCIAGLDRLTSGEAFIGDTHLLTLKTKSSPNCADLKSDSSSSRSTSCPPSPLKKHQSSAFPRWPQRRSQWIDTVIDTVSLRDRLSHRPSELSGDSSNVAVARALASRPTIIFADEPTGNLDSNSGSEVLAFMRRAVGEFGQTIVIDTMQTPQLPQIGCSF